MPHNLSTALASIGIDVGKNSFHVVGGSLCDRPTSEVSRGLGGGTAGF
jgi:hypothetical protein